MTQPIAHGNSGEFVVCIDPEIQDLIRSWSQHRQEDIESIIEALEEGDL